MAVRGLWVGFALFGTPAAFAVDSYRYLHVTIDTPWSIFLFLLPMVLSPFILMAILYWYFASRKRRDAAIAARRHPVAEAPSENSSNTEPMEVDRAVMPHGPRE